jgi:hypothetical protein
MSRPPLIYWLNPTSNVTLILANPDYENVMWGKNVSGVLQRLERPLVGGGLNREI